MRQLETLVGADTFRKGIRQYLNRFQFSNSTWSQLIDILDQLSTEDLKTWSKTWVEKAGRPRVVPQISRRSDGTVHSISVSQSDQSDVEINWTQQMESLLIGESGQQSIPLYLSSLSSELLIPATLGQLQCVLLNGSGTGYGLFELDNLSRSFLLSNLPKIGNQIARAVAWVTLWDEMLEGRVAPDEMLKLAQKFLAAERNELIAQHVLGNLQTIFWRFLSDRDRQSISQDLEHLLWRGVRQSLSKSLRSAYFRAYRSMALTPEGITQLKSVWDKKTTIPGITFEEVDFMAMAYEIAVRDFPDSRQVLETQLDRIQNLERKAQFEFVLPALSSQVEKRDDFFRSLGHPENRRREQWVLRALNYLHHPLRAGQSIKYVQPSLEMLEEIRDTGDIFFPKAWLDATFRGHRSHQAANTVRRFVQERPNYPSRLREKILQSADLLFRASSTVHP